MRNLIRLVLVLSVAFVISGCATVSIYGQNRPNGDGTGTIILSIDGRELRGLTAWRTADKSREISYTTPPGPEAAYKAAVAAYKSQFLPAPFSVVSDSGLSTWTGITNATNTPPKPVASFPSKKQNKAMQTSLSAIQQSALKKIIANQANGVNPTAGLTLAQTNALALLNPAPPPPPPPPPPPIGGPLPPAPIIP